MFGGFQVQGFVFFFFGDAGVFFPLFEEDLFEAFFAGFLVEFGLGGDEAVGIVEDDLLNGLNGLRVFGVFGQVAGGDRQGVEDEAGAAWIEFIPGQALDDLADGGLDGGAVFGQGQIEGGLEAFAFAQVFHRASGLVVIIAEIFQFQGSGAAAMAVGEDVAALVDGWFNYEFSWHLWGPPVPGKVRKVFKAGVLGLDFELVGGEVCGG